MSADEAARDTHARVTRLLQASPSQLELREAPRVPLLAATCFAARVPVAGDDGYALGVSARREVALVRAVSAALGAALLRPQVGAFALASSVEQARLDALLAALTPLLVARAASGARRRLTPPEALSSPLERWLRHAGATLALDAIETGVGVDLLRAELQLPGATRPITGAVVDIGPDAGGALADRLLDGLYRVKLQRWRERSAGSGRGARDGAARDGAAHEEAARDGARRAAATPEETPRLARASEGEAGHSPEEGVERLLRAAMHLAIPVELAPLELEPFTAHGLYAIRATLPPGGGAPPGGERCLIPDGMRVMPTGREQTSLSELYHQGSKIHRHSRRDDACLPDDRITAAMHGVASAPGKDYSDALTHVRLPDVSAARGDSLEACILRRRSSQRLIDEAATLEQLSRVLFFSYGVTGEYRVENKGIERKVRATPSGGALYPIDLYLFVRRVQGLEAGVYYYDPVRHELALIERGYPGAVIAGAINRPDAARRAPFLVALAGCFSRNQWKYRERGYRILTLDCGHLGQSLVLTATSVKLLGLPLMGFCDDTLNDLIGLDGRRESVLCLVAIAQPAP